MEVKSGHGIAHVDRVLNKKDGGSYFRRIHIPTDCLEHRDALLRGDLKLRSDNSKWFSEARILFLSSNDLFFPISILPIFSVRVLRRARRKLAIQKPRYNYFTNFGGRSMHPLRNAVIRFEIRRREILAIPRREIRF